MCESKSDYNTMTTEDALQGSIGKWEDIVNGTGNDEGPINCPLCQKFWYNDCIGCPVMDYTEVAGCDNTPYQRYWSQGTLQSAVDMLDLLREIQIAYVDK